MIGSTVLPIRSLGGGAVIYDICSDGVGTIIAIEDSVTVITN
jgi:hypothetical protein